MLLLPTGGASVSERPPHMPNMPNFNVYSQLPCSNTKIDHCLLTTGARLGCQRTNCKHPPFPLSHPPLSLPYLLYSFPLSSPLSTSKSRRSSLAARGSCMVSLTIQSFVYHALLTIFSLFLLFFSLFTRRCVNARIHLLPTSPSSTRASQHGRSIYSRPTSF